MARVVCIDDYEGYARMIAMMLEKKGHSVSYAITPIDLGAILAARPEVLVVSIVRKLETISAGGLHDFWTEVDGARALRQLAESEALQALPLILLAIAVLEAELPQGLIRYEAFLEIPQQLDALDPLIRQLAEAGPPLP